MEAVVIKAVERHSCSLIFLHGLGDSGHGWSAIGQMFSRQLPHFKFIFPHAPVQPVTLNGGMRMPSWYDIYSLRELGVARREDEEGFERSRSLLMDLVKREMDLGIPQEKIIIGGFSQGGAVTLYSLLKSPNVKFGAALVLSSYLPMEAKAKEYFSQLNKDTPVFQTHGIDDEVVLYEYGKGTAERLKSLQMTNTTFKSYPHLGHSANDELLMEMQQFLIKNFPR